ncbi:MAG: FAD-dependent monooxygenase [Erysipelotrichales bacterium]|nr:FAD-dependent monooxygenase [Erysipelotrichales bacterium]
MIRVRQIKVDILNNDESHILNKLAKALEINKYDIISYKIKRQSLDARNKDRILYVYEIDVEVSNEEKVLKNKLSNDIFISPNEEYAFKKAKNYNNKTIIVGSGPAGLFAAFILVEGGIKPIIIERGECVEDRIKSVQNFWEQNILNINSNVQFGEGGAGTFSDGKLNTLVKDKENYSLCVLETFVRFGAPKEILYSYKPHIGTDILVKVIKNMREYILSKGAQIHYNTLMTDIIIDNNKIKGIEVNNKDIIECDNLILAIGHSARDTFKMLNEKGLSMQSKPFAVGLRIEHPQDLINRSQYGDKYKDFLGAASYKLTHQSSNGHGVYSFCMCPGGYVVNASSEEKRLAVNGMSYYKRDSKNANSALVITINSNDYGESLFAGMEFQQNLEKKAYKLGNGLIPIQLLRDYIENKETISLGKVTPCTKGKYKFANLNNLFNDELNSALKEALVAFDKKIKNFMMSDAILLGIESRTSSAIKILRNELFESNIEGIYPCGEGSGYAGGITTSAIDGIKIAECIINKD